MNSLLDLLGVTNCKLKDVLEIATRLLIDFCFDEANSRLKKNKGKGVSKLRLLRIIRILGEDSEYGQKMREKFRTSLSDSEEFKLFSENAAVFIAEDPIFVLFVCEPLGESELQNARKKFLKKLAVMGLSGTLTHVAAISLLSNDEFLRNLCQRTWTQPK